MDPLDRQIMKRRTYAYDNFLKVLDHLCLFMGPLGGRAQLNGSAQPRWSKRPNFTGLGLDLDHLNGLWREQSELIDSTLFTYCMNSNREVGRGRREAHLPLLPSRGDQGGFLSGSGVGVGGQESCWKRLTCIGACYHCIAEAGEEGLDYYRFVVVLPKEKPNWATVAFRGGYWMRLIVKMERVVGVGTEVTIVYSGGLSLAATCLWRCVAGFGVQMHFGPSICNCTPN
uniref:Uncharacterized protein n=1 Tax=Salix viminalis TaxID=40686 RepID=A0A6N2KQ43_SALVM